MVAYRYVNLYIFTDKSYGWHDSILQIFFVTIQVCTFYDSSLPSAVREGFVFGCGLSRLRRESPHPNLEWVSRLWRRGDLNIFSCQSVAHLGWHLQGGYPDRVRFIFLHSSTVVSGADLTH